MLGVPLCKPVRRVFRGNPDMAALLGHFAARALGRGWVAGVLKEAHHAARVELVRLTDRRVFPVAGVPATALNDRDVTLAFTQGRLYVGAGGIFATQLPQK